VPERERALVDRGVDEQIAARDDVEGLRRRRRLAARDGRAEQE